LARHGARTPNSWEFIPNQYTEKNGELTILGFVQQYYLGQEMRKRYIEDHKFLSENFTESEVIVKSSWKNRTVRSAVAFINGLFPQEEGVWHDNKYAEYVQAENLIPLKNKKRIILQDEIRKIKVNEDWAHKTIKIVSKEKDMHFHATKSANCPSVEDFVKDLKKSLLNEEMENYFRMTLYHQLSSSVNGAAGTQMLNAENMKLKNAKSVLDNYRCNHFHGNHHPHIDEQTLKILKKSRYHYAYKVMHVDDLVRSVHLSTLLHEFHSFLSSAQENISNTPKYVFYQGHDTNLEALLSTFLLETKIAEEEHYNIIPFSSVFSLELHKEQETVESLDGTIEVKDAYYVQLFFNDEPQLIKMCLSYKCPLNQFKKILKHHIVPELENFCKVPVPTDFVDSGKAGSTNDKLVCTEETKGYPGCEL
jgi:hypothetical protein